MLQKSSGPTIEGRLMTISAKLDELIPSRLTNLMNYRLWNRRRLCEAMQNRSKLHRVNKPIKDWRCVTCHDEIKAKTPMWRLKSQVIGPTKSGFPALHNVDFPLCDNCEPTIRYLMMEFQTSYNCPYCLEEFDLFSKGLSFAEHVQTHIPQVNDSRISQNLSKGYQCHAIPETH